MQRKLWAHQEEAIQTAKSLDYFALLFQPGCGKTATTISILRDKYNEHKQLLPTLILCPPVVIQNWREEISMWSKVKPEAVIPLKGSQKDRLKLIREAPRNSVLVTNYESLQMDELFAELLKFVEGGCLVLDEAHRVKDIKAKRTKRSFDLSDKARFRYLLTGTPILNDMMDIFAQWRVLDRGAAFGKNFFTFRAKFFEDKNRFMPKASYFPNWQPKAGADAEIKRLMQPFSMYVDKSSCLSLPPLVKKRIYVEMGSEQARMYKQMKNDLIATMETSQGTKMSIAELAITKALRLQQIVSGHLRVENDDGSVSTLTIKDNPRREALKEILSGIVPSGKAIVWAVFKENYNDIRSVCIELGVEFAELHGDIKDRDAEITRFRKDEKCRVMIGHPGAGGIGVNLVEAGYSIFYSRSFSLEYDIQAEARNYRGGSERHESVTRIDLVCTGTIDELVLKSLENKTAVSDKILKESLGEI